MVLCLDWVSPQPPHICSILPLFFFIAHLWLHFNHILPTMIAVDFCAIFSPQSHLCKQQALHFKNLDILVTILQSFQLQKKVKISAIKLIYST